MTKEKEKGPGQAPGNEPRIRTTALDMADEALQQRLEDAQVKHPAWKPEKEGAILAGKIADVRGFPFMHQGKGSIMAVVETGLEDDDNHVAFWLNTVAQSQLFKLRNEDLKQGDNPVDLEADFETRLAAIKELVGEDVIIQYTGEQKSEDKKKKGLNPYQKYTIVRKEVK